MVRKVRIAVCGLLLAAAVLFLYKGAAGGGGVTLVPSRSMKAQEVRCYGQGDKEWASDRLGDSAYTMEGSGCLTACIAASLTMQHDGSGAGEALTPGELNALFSEKGVYNESGDIVWDRIARALPEAEAKAPGSVDAKEVETFLEQGRYPLVKVKNHGNGGWHWVLLVGANENGYQCMDPLSEKGKQVPLSSHGGKIYAVRSVYWTADASGKG